ncbi:protein kinase, partial [Gemmatimonadota bacterium]
GLAHLEERSQLTQTGSTIGTLAYSPPEQITDGTVDQQSELYSLGVVLYELLTGMLPHSKSTDVETLYAIINDTPEKISESRTDLPEGLEEVLEQMLSKSPSQRFESCQQLIDDLQALYWRLETSTYQMPLAVQTVRARRRKRFIARTVLVSAAILVPLLLGVLFLGSDFRVDGEIVVVAIMQQDGNPALQRVIDNSRQEFVELLNGTGLTREVPVVSIDPNQSRNNSRTGQDEVIRRVARQERGGTAVLFDINQVDNESFEARAVIQGFLRHERFNPTYLKEGSLAEPEETLASLRDAVLAAVAFYLDHEMGSLAHDINLPDNYQAYEDYIEGRTRFNNGDYPGSIPCFIQAWEHDNTFLFSLFILGNVYGNTRSYTQMDSLVQAMKRFRDDNFIKPLDKVGIDWLDHSLDFDYATKYQDALRGIELAPYSLWDGAAAAMAVWLNYPERAVYHMKTYLKDFLLDERKIPRTIYLGTWSRLCGALHMLGRHQEELKYARQGVNRHELAPSLLGNEAIALAALGRIDEIPDIIDACWQVTDEDRLSHWSIVTSVAQELIAHGNPDAGIDLLSQLINRLENVSVAEYKTAEYWQALATAHYLASHWDTAYSLFRNLSEESPGSLTYLGFHGTCAANIGNRTEAEQIMSRLASTTDRYLIKDSYYWQARIASILGEEEAAIALLNSAIENGKNFGLYLHRESDLFPLHDHPDFQRIIEPKK